MLKQHNKHRRTFTINIDQYNFLENLNNELKDIELNLTDNKPQVLPNIFILGLPRSGTTLLSQILYNCLDIACTNNLIAKFWETPLTGCMLSKIVLGDKKGGEFQSEYGKTFSIDSPHEFSWFWHKLFLIDCITEYDVDLASKKIDWNYVENKLNNMNIIFNKPLIHKPLELAAYHLPKFSNVMKKGIFIYVKRNPLHIAMSLAKSRLDYFNNLNNWWGSYPLEYNQIKDKPWDVQIASQVHFLIKLYNDKLKTIPSDRLIQVEYESLCDNPQELLNIVIHSAKKLEYDILQNIKPNSFNHSIPDVSGEIKDRLKMQLIKLGTITC